MGGVRVHLRDWLDAVGVGLLTWLYAGVPVLGAIAVAVACG